MRESGAYGRGFAAKFGLDDAPSLMTRVLRKADVAVTEVCSENPRIGMTDALAEEDAYLIGVQLRDYPRHQMFENERALPVRDLRRGESLLYDLKRDPLVVIDKPFHSLHFYIPRATFDAVADEIGAPCIGDLEYVPGVGIADNTLFSLSQSLLEVLEYPERASQLFTDHVTLAVTTHVAQKYGNLKRVTRPIRGGLAPWQARRAKEILSASLEGNVPLRMIAEECGLSVSHFCRAFSVSVGISPHAWLLQRRVDRAKSLLMGTSSSLSDIAIACGFSDQSHFTRIFKQQVGSSPGLWRRCVVG